MWLGASPDRLVSDRSVKVGNVLGLIEIKCLKSKCNVDIDKLLQDTSFFIKKIDGELCIKRDHPNGYYTQIQMAMGLSGTTFCDFVVYTFTGMLIVRVKFDEDFFVELILKLNSFYKELLVTKNFRNIC